MITYEAFQRLMYCLGVFVLCNAPTVAGLWVYRAIRRKKKRRRFVRAARRVAAMVVVAETGGKPESRLCRAYDQALEAGYAAGNS